jgi:hypothetical protein
MSTRVVTYSMLPYGSLIDLCDAHATDEDAIAVGGGVLMQVQYGEHYGDCAVCEAAEVAGK